MIKSKKRPLKKKTNLKTQNQDGLDFFAEAGLLKRVKRSGWWVAGIKDPESVAEHSFRCAVIAFFIAHQEQADPYRAISMALFNDIHEARINDLHKMGHFYIDFRAAEQKVFHDQVKNLPKKVKDALVSIREDYDTQISKESLIARDADILECLVQAKEYTQSGHPIAQTFLKRAPGFLKTKTAKALWESLKKWDSSVWWDNIVKFER